MGSNGIIGEHAYNNCYTCCCLELQCKVTIVIVARDVIIRHVTVAVIGKFYFKMDFLKDTVVQMHAAVLRLPAATSSSSLSLTSFPVRSGGISASSSPMHAHSLSNGCSPMHTRLQRENDVINGGTASNNNHHATKQHGNGYHRFRSLLNLHAQRHALMMASHRQTSLQSAASSSAAIASSTSSSPSARRVKAPKRRCRSLPNMTSSSGGYYSERQSSRVKQQKQQLLWHGNDTVKSADCLQYLSDRRKREMRDEFRRQHIGFKFIRELRRRRLARKKVGALEI